MANATLGLSGKTYVSVRCQPGEFRPVKLYRRPWNCRHVESVCIECVESWSWDWEFNFHSTEGGRWLRRTILSNGIEFTATYHGPRVHQV